METPDTIQGEITEIIMSSMSKHRENSIIKLETPEYNKIYSHVLSVLNKFDITYKNTNNK